MVGISRTVSLTNSWPSSMPFGSSNPTWRIRSMMSSSWATTSAALGLILPGGETKSECQLVEEEGEVGMAAPGLHAPADAHFVVAGL